jgi:hypothetical protein
MKGMIVAKVLMSSSISAQNFEMYYIPLKQGAMVQITVPKKLEQTFEPLLVKVEGSVCALTYLNAIDIKQRTYTYHHQNYMLQFEQNLKVQHVHSLAKEEFLKICAQFLSFWFASSKGCSIQTSHRY